MPATFYSMPAFLSSLHSLPQVASATTVLRLPLDARLSWSDTEHVYRLPPSTTHVHWTHYKVALHGAAGHPQRIPSLIIKDQQPKETILQQEIDPSMEWKSMPLFVHSDVELHIGIPPTVSSEHCFITILLRGIAMEEAAASASKHVSSLSS